MPLPTSGPISTYQINVELGRPGTTSIAMNQTDVRQLAQDTSGAIAFSQFYGKSSFIGKGGDEFTPGDGYKYHIFQSPGTFELSTTTSLQYVVVGGGGGGGPTGGGGGGGGVASGSGSIPSGSYSITVGSGGAAGNKGQDSVIQYGQGITGEGGGWGGGGGPALLAPGARED